MSNKAGLWEAEWRTAVKKIERQDAELTKLKADVVKLRTALEPFAEIANLPNHKVNTDRCDFRWLEGNLTLGCFRNAARALEETKP